MQPILPTKAFITGTDTEIGKTFVTAQLLANLQANNLSATGLKPIISGGMDDVTKLHQNSNDNLSIKQRYLYAFEPAIAPHIAAAKTEDADNQQQLDSSKIINFLQEPHDSTHTLIEGFGGWLAPISEGQTMAECVVKAQIPVILVVGMRLGCLNHALLTKQSIINMGGIFYGWIANVLPPQMPELEANINTLTKFFGKPIMICS